jgi:hypothetical protein
MRRLLVLATACVLAWVAACSGSDGGAGPGSGADGGTDGQDGGGSSSGSTPPPAPAYAGGDVTISIVRDPDAGAPDAGMADGGAADLVTGKVTIHMEAATPAAISRIEALVDGKMVGVAAQPPYDVAWDSATVANGPHSVSAKPYDQSNRAGTGGPLAITTSNFLLAGTYTWSGITDSSPGFSSDPCQSKTFTVTFNQATSTVTLPQFYLTCTAQNNAPYSSNIHGFSMVVTPDKYDGPIVNKTGTVTTTLTATKLTQTDSFNGNTQTGTLTKM